MWFNKEDQKNEGTYLKGNSDTKGQSELHFVLNSSENSNLYLFCKFRVFCESHHQRNFKRKQNFSSLDCLVLCACVYLNGTKQTNEKQMKEHVA